MPYFLLEFTEPQKLRAGYAGENREPFYFGCADCDAKDPVIKGTLCATENFQWEKVGLIGKTPPYKIAVFCAPCFDKRLAASAKPEPALA